MKKTNVDKLVGNVSTDANIFLKLLILFYFLP